MRYESLLELPLFQGMSRNDMDEVVSKTKFGFVKFAAGRHVVSEGAPCIHLYFLMSGTLKATARADDHSYSLDEELCAPDVLQPERIFGLSQRFTHTFTAATPCSFMRIDKKEVLRLSQTYEIFRFNLLNMVCTQSQKLMRQPWRPQPATIRLKVLRFAETHSLRPSGSKTLHIKMETLARLIGESRLNLSHELNAMNTEGLITLTRSNIHIPALEKLRE